MDSEDGHGGSLPAVFFDYSDLLLYFRHNRFPTGIQRVQIELFKASLAWRGSPALRPCAYSHNAGFWVEVDIFGFRRLCELSARPGSRSDQDWQTATEKFYPQLDSQKPCAFPVGSALLVAGPTWWIPNYMALIREAKAMHGIRYVPLLYDFIPMLFPEIVDENVAPAFNHWISSVFEHADLLATISKSTRDDAVRVVGARHRLARSPKVVPLDGEFGSAADLPPPEQRLRLLRRFGLAPGGFVLFVGTLEARKNHRLVFQAWSQLLEQGGDLPTLVCVGKKGWSFGGAQAVLDNHPKLLDKVLMLSGISDLELRTLYGDCLFTVYASMYEGWGLPVTESLCYGKACLTANVSSLPEAGGRFADYYEPESVGSFVGGARRLIFDRAYRVSREALIAAEFRPRSWDEVLAGLVAGVVESFPGPARPEPLAPELEPGTIYDLASHPRLARPDRVTAQAEMLCVKQEWYPFEPWGAWSRERRAGLHFQLPASFPAGDLVVQLQLRGPEEPVTVDMAVAGERIETLRLSRHERRFLTLLVPTEAVARQRSRRQPIQLDLGVDRLVHLLPHTQNDDRRVGVGVEFLAVHPRDDIESRLDVVEVRLGMAGRVGTRAW